MIDINKDKKLALEWLENQEGEMDHETLVYLSINGLDECSGFCASKKYCAEGACHCLRQIFPTPNHYQLYLELRRIYLEWMNLAVISTSTPKEEIEKISKDRREN
tara:strand:- start:1839 stop:2153 length:315 start_codon:yes stop_codon:yes gene_type:complete